ncbi:hypothetical protein LZ30DRAFT_785814 [Colletotrichum cereale]|nr:hypothetical protein LZ30DRAFT_785814 [Colletotrichum cereale]
MASPALSSAQANAYGPGPIGTHQPSPTHLQYTMQQHHQQRQTPSAPKHTPVPVPDPRHPHSNGNEPFAPAVSSDIPQAANRSSPLLNQDEQKAQRFAADYAKLSALLAECDPDAVRRAIRDNHERCLLGSHYHTAFLMNVTMHRADVGILQRAIRDFGSQIVSAGKNDLIGWMSPSDLDEVADKIIAKASNTFLDKALVARLPTIDARRLVNALARAERLGYDANDIVNNEHVIPNSLPSSSTPAVTAQQQPGPAKPPAPTPAQQITVAQLLAQLPPQPPDSIDPSTPRCQNCQRGFAGPNAYAYHIRKHLCSRPAPPAGPGGERYICYHCTQTFTTMGGLQYHMMNKVCGDYGEVTKAHVAATMPLASLNPPTKRSAPDNAPTDAPSASNSPAPHHPSAAPVAARTPRAPPPITQPGSSESAPLGTPQAKDMSHLTANQVHALKEELRLAEETFKAKIEDAQRAGGDADEVQKRLVSLRNSYACKQSIIRKKYNIRLRQRRGRGEMEQERVRMGIPDHVARIVGTPTRDVHADKRARINGNGDATTTTTTTTTEASRQATPIKTVAVTEMGNGLNGSNATAATQDPTMNASQPARPSSSQGEPSRPSSSYQQGGYRVDVHVPSPSKKPSSSAPVGGTPSQVPSGGSLTAEKLLQQMRGTSGASGNDDDDEDDSSSDDSSSDDEE